MFEEVGILEYAILDQLSGPEGVRALPEVVRDVNCDVHVDQELPTGAGQSLELSIGLHNQLHHRNCSSQYGLDLMRKGALLKDLGKGLEEGNGALSCKVLETLNRKVNVGVGREELCGVAPIGNDLDGPFPILAL